MKTQTERFLMTLPKPVHAWFEEQANKLGVSTQDRIRVSLGEDYERRHVYPEQECPECGFYYLIWYEGQGSKYKQPAVVHTMNHKWLCTVCRHEWDAPEALVARSGIKKGETKWVETEKQRNYIRLS